MTYYKIIGDNALLGVANTANLVKHQKKHNILLFSTEDNAQYIQVGEKLFHDKWMVTVSTDEFPYEEASIVAIDEEEYKSLLKLLESGSDVPVPEQEEPAPESEPQEESGEVPVQEDEVTTEFVRNAKLKELRIACTKAITGGFDIELDGEQCHFSMTSTDQLNLNSASMQVLSGEKSVAYHSDGGDYCDYSSDEMLQIIGAANAHKTYHLAYFNSLKKWVNALSRLSSIQAVEYGAEIPKKYQTKYFQSLAKEG